MLKTLTTHGQIEYSALMRELEGYIGPVAGDRWNLVYQFGEAVERSVTVTLADESIDAGAVQAILDAHVSDAAVTARAATREAWEHATQPECSKCGSRRWQHGVAHDGDRAVHFAIFAVVLLAIGGIMHVAGAPWPLVPVGLALFVLFQGALKWFSHAARRCKDCGHKAWDWFGKPPTRPG